MTTNDLEKEITTFTQTVRQHEEARAGLQQKLGEAGSQAFQRSEETKARETEFNNEINLLKSKVDNLMGIIRERVQDIHERDFTISQKDKEINTLNLKLSNLSEMKSLNEKYADQVNNAEQARIDLQNKFTRCLDDHQDQLKQEHDERQKLINEKNEISNQLRDAQREITDLKNVIDNLRDTVDQRDQTIHDLKNRLAILDEIKAQREKLFANLKDFEASRDRLHKEIESLKVEFENIRKQDQVHFNQIHKEKSEVEEILKTRETKITELETRIYEINTIVFKQKQEIDSCNAESNRLRDVENQLLKAHEVQDEYVNDRANLRRELDKKGDFMIELEEKVHKANSTSLTLLNKVKDSEREIDVLKDYIYELKSRVAIYIPVREDPIDKKLAEYINNYPDRSKLKIMFMRESSGIYQFGSRKIYVRVEKDRIIIRVGGGYLTIDEFLDIYTPIELEKIERKGTSKKVVEKMAIQRTLIGRELREESPIRSSPTRKAVRKSPLKKSS